MYGRHSGKNIGPALQRLRKSRGLTQRQLAARLGRSPQNVSRIEQYGSNPFLGTMLKYLDALGCSLTELHVELTAMAAEEGDGKADPPAR